MKTLFLEIKFEGGLGNQLFQYAAGRSLAIKNDIDSILLNADSYLDQPLERKFSLTNYSARGTVIENTLVKKIFRPKTKLNALAKLLHCYTQVEDNGFKLVNFENKKTLLISLKGYWQSECYFSNIRPTLLKELMPINIPPLPSWVDFDNTVAIHVRRTDYLAEPRYGFVGVDYYYTAINIFKKRMDNPLFIFFSDDLSWCKENFFGDNIIFFDEFLWKEDYLQLYLMSKCRHQVIANSSFSWWSAWLNQNETKMVIRPLNPFKEKSLLYESHYPSEWIAIENNE